MKTKSSFKLATISTIATLCFGLLLLQNQAHAADDKRKAKACDALLAAYLEDAADLVSREVVEKNIPVEVPRDTSGQYHYRSSSKKKTSKPSIKTDPNSPVVKAKDFVPEKKKPEASFGGTMAYPDKVARIEDLLNSETIGTADTMKSDELERALFEENTVRVEVKSWNDFKPLIGIRIVKAKPVKVEEFINHEGIKGADGNIISGTRRIKGYKVHAQTVELEDGIMELPEVIYYPPPEGFDSKTWTEKISFDGKTLQPFLKSKIIDLEGQITHELLQEWITNLAKGNKGRPSVVLNPVRGSMTRAFQDLIEGKEVSFISDDHNIWRIRAKGPRDQAKLRVLYPDQTIGGGFRSVYVDPNNSKKLVKIFDIEKSQGMNLVNFAKMLQWDLGRIYYVNAKVAKQTAEGKIPAFQLNPVDTNPKYLASGSSVVSLVRGKPFEHFLKRRTKNQVAFVERVRDEFIKMDGTMFVLGKKLYGDDFSFIHRIHWEEQGEYQYIMEFHRYMIIPEENFFAVGLDIQNNLLVIQSGEFLIAVFIDQ